MAQTRKWSAQRKAVQAANYLKARKRDEEKAAAVKQREADNKEAGMTKWEQEKLRRGAKRAIKRQPKSLHTERQKEPKLSKSQELGGQDRAAQTARRLGRMVQAGIPAP